MAKIINLPKKTPKVFHIYEVRFLEKIGFYELKYKSASAAGSVSWNLEFQHKDLLIPQLCLAF